MTNRTDPYAVNIAAMLGVTQHDYDVIEADNALQRAAQAIYKVLQEAQTTLDHLERLRSNSPAAAKSSLAKVLACGDSIGASGTLSSNAVRAEAALAEVRTILRHHHH